jgi:LmbE family N-acetylglucosaminyl deacetylase
MKKDFIIRQEQRQPLRQLYMWLKSLQSTLIFMQTGAHPDDETSRMLASLSLGDGMHVVYVNAVRGQGGQNALGPERGDALGYLRTEELFEAMRVIRADSAWLAEAPEDPITDFGFSKSGEQTFEHWGREHSLRQMVKMVRMFKPDILIPTFLDVPGQHGHHRAVTQTTIAAFEDAADQTKFADLGLPAWQVNTLYLPAWGGGGGSYDDEVPPPNATHEIDTGAFDPVLGGTYAQIGEWSRACHATQGMGRHVDEEEQPVPLHQLRTASGQTQVMPAVAAR